MDDIYTREGASFEETFTDSDITASTLTITISDENDDVVLTETENYVVQDDEGIATLSFHVDLSPGTYSYMYTIEYEDGFKLKLPDPDGCLDGECELPGFIVCDANDTGGS